MKLTRIEIRWSLVILSFIVMIYFTWRVRSSLYPFIIAFLLAYILNPAIRYVSEKGSIKRGWAIGLVYLVLFSVVFLGGSFLIPIVVEDLESVARELPEMTSKGETLLHILELNYQNFALPQSLRIALDTGLINFQTDLQQTINDLVASLVTMLTHSAGLLISPVLAFYLLHDWSDIKGSLRGVLPGRWHKELYVTLQEVDKVLSGIIRGQLLIALLVGILVSTGLYFLGIRYALIIGILAGMLDIIPYFGAFIGAVPAVTVALLDSPFLAIKAAILILAIHQLEGTVIGPQILGESAGLNPLTVILVLFIGEECAGLAGMVLAVPITAISKVIVCHVIKALV
ncbi:MAG: tqsA 2 [Firmicutes bacterium]|nr:tqsA 2 [Bacillota bacterium]